MNIKRPEDPSSGRGGDGSKLITKATKYVFFVCRSYTSYNNRDSYRQNYGSDYRMYYMPTGFIFYIYIKSSFNVKTVDTFEEMPTHDLHMKSKLLSVRSRCFKNHF